MLNKLTEQYVMGRSGPRTQLFESLGSSLVAAGSATPEVSGVLKRSTGYVPQPQVLDGLRKSLIAEATSTDAPARSTVLLATLLERSKLLKDYFTHDEQALIKSMVEKHSNSDMDTVLKKSIAHIDALITMHITTTSVSASQS